MKFYKYIFIFLVLLLAVSCRKDIAGCTDPKAQNYNAMAVIEDSSCAYLIEPINNPTPVAGCTDSTAANYNPLATINDGSCQFLGCTNPDADNYDPKANVDDGSCIDKREKFVGDWQVVHDCPITFPLSDPQTISYNTIEKDSILISPFTALGDETGFVSGYSVNIPSNTVTFGGIFSLTYSANGSMNTAKNQIDMSITYSSTVGGTGTCQATYTKL